ncbi:MAG: ferritin-like domain-containing protein [Candidatus Dormibacteraeota bacterium]|nr:ferritin-like domain-containing protein [Candidatus Dormibacteraeota bacterium]
MTSPRTADLPHTLQENQTMSVLPTLDELNPDGAIMEAAEAVGTSRGDFLRRAVVAGGAFAGAGALMSTLPSLAAAATTRDLEILNFALTLEYLESTFYAEALRKGALSGRTLAFAKVVARHEAEHVKALKGALGSAAVAKPKFNFHGTTSDQGKFQKTAIVLEDTGVCAYKGQAPRIQETAYLKVALSIHTVEAHHASWIRHIAGKVPAPVAFDKPCTMQQVLADVAGTHFIVSAAHPRPTPSFTG